MSSLLLCYYTRKYGSLKEALKNFCVLAKVKQEELFLPSQKLYFSYIENIFAGITVTHI